MRFKGRGPIQVTGRANYAKAARETGLDLSDPTVAATPDVGFRLASWFWDKKDLNEFADAGEFDRIPYRVNGGYNGKAHRDELYKRGLSVFARDGGASAGGPATTAPKAAPAKATAPAKAAAPAKAGATGPSWTTVRRGGAVLREGASGVAVRELQQLLAKKGYDVAADGKFGPRTEMIVQHYQQSVGLEMDGVVGAGTARALGS